MPEPGRTRGTDEGNTIAQLRKAQAEAAEVHRRALRAAWNRKPHDGWMTQTWAQPGNQRMRVYLACILHGVDWGNPDWPVEEEQRLFYDPPGEEAIEEDDDSNHWHDGFAGSITGLVLALGAGICMGWIRP